VTIAPLASSLLRLWRDYCPACVIWQLCCSSALYYHLFVLIYFRVTSAPACHLSPLAPSLRFHRFASPRFASPRLTSLHLVIIAHVCSLILLVATLLVHPPLSLLPATSPLPPRSYLLAIPPANSIAYHSSPSLPIAYHTYHIWRLASRGPARVPSTVHSCPPSAPSPSPYPS
jgi:hypothetical protein